MKSLSLTQAELLTKLHYDPDSGYFSRLLNGFVDERKDFPVGHINKRGYVCISINNIQFKAHRLAILYMTGKWPDQTDHANHIKHDNRWCNIRSVTAKENGRNRKLGSNSSDIIMGVYKCTDGPGWKIYISKVYLGRKDSYFDACCVRKSAELKHNYHSNHGGVYE